MKKILLVNLPVSIRNPMTAIPPLPLLVLGGILRDLNSTGVKFFYELVDFDLMLKQGEIFDNPQFFPTAISLISARNPIACMFTVHGANLPIVVRTCRELKAVLPSCVNILGGVAPTLQAVKLVENFSGVDMVIRGEAETALQALVTALLTTQDFTGVPSAVFKKNGKIIENPRKRMTAEDRFTSPDYSLIDLSRYLAHNRKYPYIVPGFALVESGRGCQWNCSFCAPNKMWGRKVLYRPYVEILDEMNFLKEHGFDFTFFTQDNLDENFINGLCELIQLSGKEYSWGCYSRLDMLSLETGKKMAEKGCKLIFSGLETPDSAAQSFIRKKIDFEAVIGKIAAFNSYGISFICSFISGFPDETGEQLNNTMRFAIECSAGKTFEKILEIVSQCPQGEFPPRQNFCTIHPLGVMPGTDCDDLFKERLRLTPYPLHHDVFGTYLLALDDFVKENWRIIGATFTTHLPDSMLLFQLTHLRVFDVLNGIPYQLSSLLQKGDLEPIELIKDIVRRIGTEDSILTMSEEDFLQSMTAAIKAGYEVDVDFSRLWVTG